MTKFTPISHAISLTIWIAGDTAYVWINNKPPYVYLIDEGCFKNRPPLTYHMEQEVSELITTLFTTSGDGVYCGEMT